MSGLACPYCMSKNEKNSVFCLQCGSLLLEDSELKAKPIEITVEEKELAVIIEDVEEKEEEEELTVFEGIVFYSGIVLSFILSYWLIGFKLINNGNLLEYFIQFTVKLVFLLVGFIIIFCVYLFIYVILTVICELIYEKYFLQVNVENGS